MSDGEALALLADPEWAIGDQVLEAGGNATAKQKVARENRRDPRDVTLMVAVCEAFPVDQRHPSLTFSHHEAVVQLAPDDRPAMLDQAAQQGWSARKLRRHALNQRVATGDLIRLSDDDPEDAAFVRLARAWNHAPESARMALGDLYDEHGIGDIIL